MRLFLAVFLVTRVAALVPDFADLLVAAFGVTFLSAISIHLPRTCAPSRARFGSMFWRRSWRLMLARGVPAVTGWRVPSVTPAM